MYRELRNLNNYSHAMISALEYVGCYKDSGKDRAINNSRNTFYDLTPEICAKRCISQGCKYIGLQVR